MNLQDEINPKLWEAIVKPYEAGLYKNAILNGFHYLTDVLRDKADLAGDGAQLIGQALGGKTPKLRINRFQTQAEKDEQEGLTLMLLGLYQGIRNPRSHERMEDSKISVDATIIFINYLLSWINKAKPSFVLETWIEMVFDEHFVPSKEYVDTLVAEVPPSKRFDTLIYLFEINRSSKGNNLRLVSNTIASLLDNDQQNSFMEIVSQALRRVVDESDIRRFMQFLPAQLWMQIHKLPKVRIENRLIASIEEGRYNQKFDVCNDEGTLGTWAGSYLKYFEASSKIRLFTIFSTKLSANKEEAIYVVKYFFWQLPNVVSEDKSHNYRTTTLVHAICQITHSFPEALILKEYLQSRHFYSFPWSSSILTKLKDINPELYEELAPTDEDIPF